MKSKMEELEVTTEEFVMLYWYNGRLYVKTEEELIPILHISGSLGNNASTLTGREGGPKMRVARWGENIDSVREGVFDGQE